VLCYTTTTDPPGKYICQSTFRFAITVGNVGKDFENYLKTQNFIANATFVSWDANAWDILYPGPLNVVYAVILVPLFSLNVVLASYKVYNWIKSVGWEKLKISIGLSCLILEWLASFMRILNAIFMPAFLNLYKIHGIDLLITVPLCLSMISAILLIFFWFEITTNPFARGKKSGFLGKLKIPCIILSVLFILVEIFLDIFRTILFFFDMQSVLIICYFVIHALVAILYFVAAYRILAITNKSADKQRLRSITYKIVASGIATVFVTFFMILFLADAVSAPLGQYFNMQLSGIALFFQGFFVILIFEPIKRNSDSSALKKSSKSSKSNQSSSNPGSTPKGSSETNDTKDTKDKDIMEEPLTVIQ